MDARLNRKSPSERVLLLCINLAPNLEKPARSEETSPSFISFVRKGKTGRTRIRFDPECLLLNRISNINMIAELERPAMIRRQQGQRQLFQQDNERSPTDEHRSQTCKERSMQPTNRVQHRFQGLKAIFRTGARKGNRKEDQASFETSFATSHGSHETSPLTPFSTDVPSSLRPRLLAQQERLSVPSLIQCTPYGSMEESLGDGDGFDFCILASRDTPAMDTGGGPVVMLPQEVPSRLQLKPSPTFQTATSDASNVPSFIVCTGVATPDLQSILTDDYPTDEYSMVICRENKKYRRPDHHDDDDYVLPLFVKTPLQDTCSTITNDEAFASEATAPPPPPPQDKMIKQESSYSLLVSPEDVMQDLEKSFRIRASSGLLCKGKPLVAGGRCDRDPLGVLEEYSVGDLEMDGNFGRTTPSTGTSNSSSSSSLHSQFETYSLDPAEELCSLLSV